MLVVMCSCMFTFRLACCVRLKKPSTMRSMERKLRRSKLFSRLATKKRRRYTGSGTKHRIRCRRKKEVHKKQKLQKEQQRQKEVNRNKEVNKKEVATEQQKQKEGNKKKVATRRQGTAKGRGKAICVSLCEFVCYLCLVVCIEFFN